MMGKHKKSKNGRKSHGAKRAERSSTGSSGPGSTAAPSIPTVSELLRPTGTGTVELGTYPPPLRSLSPWQLTQTHPTRTDANREDGDLVQIKIGIPWKMKKEIEAVAEQMGTSQNEVARRMFGAYLDAYALVHRPMR